jgi:hypothetical protein
LAIEHRRAFLEMYRVTHRSTWKHKTKLKKKEWYKRSSREFQSKIMRKCGCLNGFKPFLYSCITCLETLEKPWAHQLDRMEYLDFLLSQVNYWWKEFERNHQTQYRFYAAIALDFPLPPKCQWEAWLLHGIYLQWHSNHIHLQNMYFLLSLVIFSSSSSSSY